LESGSKSMVDQVNAILVIIVCGTDMHIRQGQEIGR
jgi:hypothetical protein